MIALKLTDKKTFINQLLCSEIFDHFLLSEASIARDASFTVDGHINSSFYSKEELAERNYTKSSVLPYSKLRPVCCQLMRGNRAPVYFKFILMLSPENTANTLARSESGFTPRDIKGIFINLTFQNGDIVLTTGISYTVFSANHLLDQEWDKWIRKFLYKNSITYEEL